MHHYPYSFTINRQVLSVHLGYYDGERSKPQDIAIDIRLYFAKLPECARTDKAPFIDYAILVHALRDDCLGKEFALIEHMANVFFGITRAIMDEHCPKDDIKLWLRVTKLKTPLKGLEHGASFIASDLPAGATTVPVV